MVTLWLTILDATVYHLHFLQRSDRDWKKLQRALNEREMTSVAAAAMNSEQRMQQLQQMYEDAVEHYRVTINRLKTFG